MKVCLKVNALLAESGKPYILTATPCTHHHHHREQQQHWSGWGGEGKYTTEHVVSSIFFFLRQLPRR